ncbi:hypothetical protein CDA63_05925 [Hymenobacter amundsenii]|uniref:Uncharacterized protein n=1 Tax=Hymenobacter amundsenii TaxID=2006685 RepID=A0A246FMQ2_9BACT|nr:hypothetical protein [Hymenobacter amundsenii]OWP64002.1 hypothetical protein CDA63_05925 [Hymenobacter amundsenii]
MKRLASLLLLLAYLFASPGLVYSLHLCGQQVTGVSLSGVGEPAGCCPESAKPVKGMKGCCHDQKVASSLKDVKLTTAQLKLVAPVALPAPPALRVVRHLALTYPADEPAPRLRVASGPPPPACPAYVRGHAFLI